MDGVGAVKVCKECILASNPLSASQSGPATSGSSSQSTTPQGRSRSNSASSVQSNTSTKSSTKSSTKGKSSATISTEQLMEQLSKLNKIDTLEESLRQISTKLEPVQLIPQILQRVEANEKEVASLKQEQEALRSDFEAWKEANASGVLPAGNGRLVELEEQNAKLSNQVKTLLETRKDNPDELIIGGVSCPDISGADLKLLSYAILKAVCNDLVPHDVLAARLLPSRDGQNTASGESRPGGSQRNGTPTSRIVVSMHSSSLVNTIVTAKAKLGKMHSSRVNTTLLAEANVTSLSPSHININEMLPAEVYKLRREVFRKAKEQPRFSAFVRHGQLFVRRKRDQAPVVITSFDDLEHFLS